eukprot:TRINITY_DN3640_c0_g1_i3.p1 TRINITY_DN3640_c0_g1~~TRINITY_DN3640_c0_g1_i3.p1  ORF type:complete len:105 (+),score=21.32 TRINITY_DN3640_c0_g1_i3:90-404(+)
MSGIVLGMYKSLWFLSALRGYKTHVLSLSLSLSLSFSLSLVAYPQYCSILQNYAMRKESRDFAIAEIDANLLKGLRRQYEDSKEYDFQEAMHLQKYVVVHHPFS